MLDILAEFQAADRIQQRVHVHAQADLGGHLLPERLERVEDLARLLVAIEHGRAVVEAARVRTAW